MKQLLRTAGKDRFIRWVIALAALAMMVGGIMNGEIRTVFIKAANICLECIGIG